MRGRVVMEGVQRNAVLAKNPPGDVGGSDQGQGLAEGFAPEAVQVRLVRR
jgi:hypothetical protein